MKIVDFLKDDELIHLIPKTIKFAESTDTPLYLHLHEITTSFTNPNYIVIVGKNDDIQTDGGIVAYVVILILNPYEAMITQYYSEDPHISRTISNFVDTHLQSLGIKKVHCLSKPHPRVFARYGYKLTRYVMSKDLKGGN